MTDRVQCILCGHRTRRAWRECACYEMCACSSYGTHVGCGGNYYLPEIIRRWKKFDKEARQAGGANKEEGVP